MYTASADFHTAVAEGKPQKALLIFSDRVFTNDDIDVEYGIELNEYFSTEKNLSIGQALSSEIRFAVFNPEGLLDEYGFGEFTATLGVRILDEPTEDRVVCRVKVGNTNWTGARVTPYLTIGSSAAANQPSHPVTSMLLYNSKVYCFGNGNVTVYSENGSIVNESVSAFMKRKAEKNWQGCGYAWNPGTRILEEWKDMRYRKYEFVPLGIFNAERPDVPTVDRIEFTCNDRMMKFDKDMPNDSTLGITYPTTIETLLTKICTYYGVTKRSGSFINSGAEITKRPEDFDNATGRTVLGWIAEAAASNARIDRDGYLVLDWMRTTNLALDEHNYVEFSPCWFETQQITKLHNRSTQNTSETVVGSGTAAYLIQDNPLLRGAE